MSTRWNIEHPCPVALLVGITTAFVTLNATAASRGLELRWDAPTGCPTHSDVLAEVDELLYVPPSKPRDVAIVAQASVARGEGGFVLWLALRDADGLHERRVGAPTCEELAHAAALIVALAIDPAATEGRLNSAATGLSSPLTSTNHPATPVAGMHCRLTDLPLPAQTQPPAPVSPPIFPPARAGTSADTARPSKPTVAASPIRPKTWRFGFGGFVAVNVLPSVNLGMNLLGAVQGKGARLEIAASALSTNVSSPSIPSRSASFSLYRVTPRACWLIAETRSFGVGPCAGLELGILLGQGSGVDLPKASRRAWLASSFGGVLELSLTSGALLLVGVDLGVAMRREEYRLANEPLYRPGESVSAGANLVAGWD